MKQERGFSLVELLAVIALLGLLAMALSAVMPRVWAEADGIETRAARFEDEWTWLRLLERDAGLARSARLTDGWLILASDSGDPVVYRAEPEGLWRHGATSRSFALLGDSPSLTVETRAGRIFVSCQFLGDHSERVHEWRVGSQRRTP